MAEERPEVIGIDDPNNHCNNRRVSTCAECTEKFWSVRCNHVTGPYGQTVPLKRELMIQGLIRVYPTSRRIYKETLTKVTINDVVTCLSILTNVKVRGMHPADKLFGGQVLSDVEDVGDSTATLEMCTVYWSVTATFLGFELATGFGYHT